MMEAEQMKALIEKARDHKMTPAERFEQRVSFVYSGVSSTTTREDVRARLAEEYGDPMAYEARITDLEARLAARDAEIAAWLEQWANAEAFQKALGGITPPVTHEAILRNLATVIASGAYRKETP